MLKGSFYFNVFAALIICMPCKKHPASRQMLLISVTYFPGVQPIIF